MKRLGWSSINYEQNKNTQSIQNFNLILTIRTIGNKTLHAFVIKTSLKSSFSNSAAIRQRFEKWTKRLIPWSSPSPAIEISANVVCFFSNACFYIKDGCGLSIVPGFVINAKFCCKSWLLIPFSQPHGTPQISNIWSFCVGQDRRD